MLKENEDVISFHPGGKKPFFSLQYQSIPQSSSQLRLCISFEVRKKNGQTAIGRIVVHDRAKVESEILPRYFNHSSFASLRRQLNYFAFCRIGKGKQRGAIYCNDKVVELEDILRLKRRAVGSAVVPTVSDTCGANVQVNPRKTLEYAKVDQIQSKKKSCPKHSIHKKLKGLKASKPYVSSRMKKRSIEIANSVVPVVHLPKYDNTNELISSQCYDIPVLSHTTSVTPSPTPQRVGCSSQISLDLTKSFKKSSIETNFPTSNSIFRKDHRMKNETLSTTIHHDFSKSTIANKLVSVPNKTNTKEADILAGCSALLSLGCQ